MSLPLPNPISPPQGNFISRLINTRKCLNSLSEWSSTTGQVRESERGLPFFSVMLITFNHEDYIRKALDSILMQERDFPIEINVVDDASTDNTQAIVREYCERYPDIVNCYFNPVNVGHIATQLNTIRGFKTLRGRYFAILEGDDYWTDSTKISKQVAFLEAHSDYVACAHQTLKVFDDNSQPPEHFLPVKGFGSSVAKMYDLISMGGVFHLSSIVYRNVFHQAPPACLYDKYSCEVTINMLYGVFGNFYCFDEYMSVYRVHAGGVFSVRSQEKIWRFHLFGFGRFACYLGPKYLSMFARAVRGFSRYVLMAPYRTKEVTGLSLSTWILFLIYFVVATVVSFIYLCFRGIAFLVENSKLPLADLGALIVFELRKTILELLPGGFVRWLLKMENRFPVWGAVRKGLWDWVAQRVLRANLSRFKLPAYFRWAEDWVRGKK